MPAELEERQMAKNTSQELTNPGHRQRLRDRFLNSEEGSRSDEALLELLLTLTIPQKDVRPQVERLLTEYSDLFEQYIYGVKDKPRRQMADILPDYFYKTDDGTWRFPASEEEEKAKADARAQGLGRRVKRYIAMLEYGIAIPEREQQSDATLAQWLRHCKRTGMYAQGRILYEKGGLNIDNLSDEAMAAAEEDYQTCCRMLRRVN